MKQIALTFDDGREDNATIANPILRRYGLNATLFVTTGYLDHTWARDPRWTYSGEPMTIDQLRQLRDGGWEIGLHGDWHRTALEDWKSALEKLKAWGFDTEGIGASLPNSRVEEAEIGRILQALGSRQLSYIRRGRGCDTGKLENKLLFGMYTWLNSFWAFRRFNRENLMRLPIREPAKLYSVVVRHRDRPEMLLELMDAMEEDSLCVLMLHSILPESHPNYGKEVWNWSDTRFEALCAGLQKRCQEENFTVGTLKSFVSGERCGGSLE